MYKMTLILIKKREIMRKSRTWKIIIQYNYWNDQGDVAVLIEDKRIKILQLKALCNQNLPHKTPYLGIFIFSIRAVSL